MKNFLGHLHTINHHRRLVRQGCFRMGLYWQGLTHDLSKYARVEFSTGVRYYQGTRSPNTAEREEKGWSEAWMHHKGRNRHHWEYWTDLDMKQRPTPRSDAAEISLPRWSPTASPPVRPIRVRLTPTLPRPILNVPRALMHADTVRASGSFWTMRKDQGDDDLHFHESRPSKKNAVL